MNYRWTPTSKMGVKDVDLE